MVASNQYGGGASSHEYGLINPAWTIKKPSIEGFYKWQLTRHYS
jgi:hypothetical protein